MRERRMDVEENNTGWRGGEVRGDNELKMERRRRRRRKGRRRRKRRRRRRRRKGRRRRGRSVSEGGDVSCDGELV